MQQSAPPRKPRESLVPSDPPKSPLDPGPVDVPGVPSEKACRGVGDGELGDPEAGGRPGEEPCRHGHPKEVVEGSGELTLHLVFAELIAEYEVHDIVDPAEALPIAQQFRRQAY